MDQETYELAREFCPFYRYSQYYKDMKIIRVCINPDGDEYCTFESCPLVGDD